MALTATIDHDVNAVRLDYTVPAGAATATLSRVGPSGTPAIVRGHDNTAATPGLLIVRDYEAPIGVALTYTAQSFNAAAAVVDTQTTKITIPSTGCEDTWLTDLAKPTNTLQILIESLPDLEHEQASTVHDIIGRRTPIVTADIAKTPTFELSVLTETLDERDSTRSVLGNGVTVLLRTPPEDGIGNLYFAVTGFHEQRIVTSGTLADRRFVISGRQVDRPDPALWMPAAPSTYATVHARYATYSALKAARATYDAVLYDWSGAAAPDVVPWPPVDV
jgi:hypothetical protein